MVVVDCATHFLVASKVVAELVFSHESAVAKEPDCVIHCGAAHMKRVLLDIGIKGVDVEMVAR